LLTLLAAFGCASTETDTRTKQPAKDSNPASTPAKPDPAPTKAAPVSTKPVELDGIWQREDGKLYAIGDDKGVELPLGGEYASRLTLTRAADDKIALRLHFTRVADEQGWLETRATSKGAVPAKAKSFELEVEFVDLDDAGKVVNRGTESHTFKLLKAVEEKDRAKLKAMIAFHAKIDSFLDPSKQDLKAALAAADEALADPELKGDKLFQLRRNAIALAAGVLPRPTNVDPAAPPIATTFLELVPSEMDPKIWGKWQAQFRYTNVGGKPVKEAELDLHYLDADGKELDRAFRHTAMWLPGLEPGASEENKGGFNIPEGTKTVRGELLVATYADDTKWTRPARKHAAKAASGDPNGPPLTLEFLRVADSFGKTVAKVRATNLCARDVAAFKLQALFLDAGGKALAKPCDGWQGFGEPIESGDCTITDVSGPEFGPLPEGTKSVMLYLESVSFKDNTSWENSTPPPAAFAEAAKLEPSSKGAPAAPAGGPPHQEATGDLVELSLGDLGATIKAPKGARLDTQFLPQVILGDGQEFAIEITEGAADMTKRKAEIKANDINVLKRYVLDTPEAIIYESSVMGSEFHFLANVTVGDRTFKVEDVKGAPRFTREQVEKMLECAKTLAARKD
jgi:hypothetical protein